MACLGASLAGAPMAASLSFAAWGKSSPKFCQTPMLPSTGHSVFDCSGYSGGQHTTFAGQQKNFETLSQRMTSFLLCAAMCMPLYMGRKNIRKSNSLRRVITTEPIMMEASPSETAIPCNQLIVGIPVETYSDEARVAATPSTVQALRKEGYNVVVESSAGLQSGYTDVSYEEAGARIADQQEVWSSDIVMKVRPPTVEEADRLKEGSTLISVIGARLPGSEPLIQRLSNKRLNVIGIDSLPRQLSRAQTYDILSSMANLAGYRAVVEGAAALPRFMAGQFTAAGRVEPAKVLVIGAGVAGLQAIQAAKNLGAVVRAFDVRSSAKEQVESCGAEFLQVEIEEDGEGTGGYAKEMSKAFLDAEMELFKQQCRECDVVITTALIPGKPAPKLITADMIDVMKPGSVIVDLAASNGGNCEACVTGQKSVTPNGVTVIGTDMVQSAASQASDLFSNNISKFLLSMGGKGTFFLSEEDEAVRGCWIVKDGERLPEPQMKPKPPPPPPQPSVEKQESLPDAVVISPEKLAFRQTRSKVLRYTVGIAGMCFLGRCGGTITALATTLSLACLIGSNVVKGVTAALHSPLMSITNAISGLTVVGGILLMGGDYLPRSLPQILAAVAVLVSMVNIGGGFTMTARMVGMFRRDGDAPSYSQLFSIPAVVFLALSAAGGSTLTPMVYLISSLLCIFSIGALSSQKTAQYGNSFGLIGVAGGLCGALNAVGASRPLLTQMAVTMALGGGFGTAIAKRVEVTSLPQLVAAFHSLVGVGATCTALASFLSSTHFVAMHSISTYAASTIGALTITGSLLAFGKLQGLLSGKPLRFRLQKVITSSLSIIIALGMFRFVAQPTVNASLLYVGTAAAGLLGWLLAAQVGGADMPVVITILNSASGWALTAEGFVLANNLLIIVGALIGSSGALLSAIMCTAMNRSLVDVLGLDSKPIKSTTSSYKIDGECSTTDIDATVTALQFAKKVVIVPGYGVAVAKGQYALAEIMQTLTDRKIDVKISIHPVAGRMPGQLNVLLAEAGIPYDQVFEMDEINDSGDWDDVDVALVVGANDTVNSLAEDDPDSPIAGMPVIRVWKAKKCIVMKRSLGVGYAALENPVFYKENTSMLLGDAKQRLEEMRDSLRAA